MSVAVSATRTVSPARITCPARTRALNRRDFDHALKHFNRAIELDPAFAEAYNQRAIVGYLQERFEEVPMARGVSGDGVLVTMFAAKATTTWTLALTDPSGVSCILDGGTGFELLPEALALPGDPAPT